MVDEETTQENAEVIPATDPGTEQVAYYPEPDPDPEQPGEVVKPDETTVEADKKTAEAEADSVVADEKPDAKTPEKPAWDKNLQAEQQRRASAERQRDAAQAELDQARKTLDEFKAKSRKQLKDEYEDAEEFENDLRQVVTQQQQQLDDANKELKALRESARTSQTQAQTQAAGQQASAYKQKMVEKYGSQYVNDAEKAYIEICAENGYDLQTTFPATVGECCALYGQAFLQAVNQGKQPKTPTKPPVQDTGRRGVPPGSRDAIPEGDPFAVAEAMRKEIKPGRYITS